MSKSRDIREKSVQELKAAQTLKEALRAMTDDDETVRDTLEGETNLDNLIRRLMLSIEEDQLLWDGCDARIKDLQSRKSRYDKRIEAKRMLILQAMEIAEWPTKEFDIGTVTVKKAAPALQIINEADIPKAYWIAGDPKLDKKSLLAALKDKQAIPGATLKNGEPQLAIRRV